MKLQDRAKVLGKVVDLRDRRVELARAEVAAAQLAVAEAVAALAARDMRLLQHDRDRAAIDDWLTGGGIDARYVDAALARQAAVAEAKAADLAARTEEEAALDRAEARRADALRELAIAQAKRDAVQDQLKGTRRALDLAREERAQVEFEDRGGRPLQLAMGGRR